MDYLAMRSMRSHWNVMFSFIASFEAVLSESEAILLGQALSRLKRPTSSKELSHSTIDMCLRYWARLSAFIPAFLMPLNQVQMGSPAVFRGAMRVTVISGALSTPPSV